MIEAPVSDINCSTGRLPDKVAEATLSLLPSQFGKASPSHSSALMEAVRS